MLAAIGIQLLLPERLTAGPSWLVASLEGVLLVGLFVVTPNVIEDEHPRRRRIALSLTAFVSAANIFSLGALTHYLLHHHVSDGRGLIVAGVLIWLTNLLIFALWYWEMDRGGPGKRATGKDGAAGLPVPADDRRSDRAARLAAEVRRLPVRLADEQHRVLADRHDAADADGEVHHGRAVASSRCSRSA